MPPRRPLRGSLLLERMEPPAPPRVRPPGARVDCRLLGLGGFSGVDALALPLSTLGGETLGPVDGVTSLPLRLSSCGAGTEAGAGVMARAGVRTPVEEAEPSLNLGAELPASIQ